MMWQGCGGAGVEWGGEVAVVAVKMGWQWVVGGDIVVTVMWMSMSSPQGGPNVGINWGVSWQQWQPHIVVVVTGSGGGGERKGWDGHECHTL